MAISIADKILKYEQNRWPVVKNKSSCGKKLARDWVAGFRRYGDEIKSQIANGKSQNQISKLKSKENETGLPISYNLKSQMANRKTTSQIFNLWIPASAGMGSGMSL